MTMTMTLLNSTKIIKHYFERPSFAILTKVKISLKQFLKWSKPPFFFLNLLILLIFKVKHSKKICCVFLELFTWNHPIFEIVYFHPPSIVVVPLLRYTALSLAWSFIMQTGVI